MINPTEIANIQDAKYQKDLAKLQKMQQPMSENQGKLMESAKQFEAVFVTKMLEIIDSTVDREGGFMAEGKTAQAFKPFYHQEIAKNIVENPNTSFGLAKQMYEQMKDKV
ncbi:MAG: rod-binding protein [Candidatus Gastranaerophilaceae bacterium]|jgi:Rod binding domain-containing protein